MKRLRPKIKAPSTPCELWQGPITPDGYGRRFVTKKGGKKDGRQLAHRVAWMDEYGAIPDGFVVVHLCAERRCVNLDHLVCVPKAEGSWLYYQGQTVCKRGHPFTPETTYRLNNGDIRCRTCTNAYMRSYRLRECPICGGPMSGRLASRCAACYYARRTVATQDNAATTGNNDTRA